MTTAAQLDVVIRAQDQSSRAINSVRKNLGGLDRATQAFGLGSVLAYGSATVALGTFARMGFNEMKQAEIATAQTNAVLESTGGIAGVTASHVEDLAEQMMELSGVDDEVVQGAENILLGFTNIRNVGVNKIFDEATLATLNLSKRLGIDAVSAADALGKALQAPATATRALRGMNIILTAEQTKSIAAFVKQGKVAEAQAVILDAVTKSVGGAAEAYGDTLAGKVDIAREKFSNFAGVLTGTWLLGLVTSIEAVGDLASGLGELADRVDVFGLLERGADGAAEHIESGVSSLEYLNRQLGITEINAFGVVAVMGELMNMPAAPGPFGPTIEQMQTGIDKAHELETAFFDALHEASPERLQRELALSQASFNVSRLDQQRAVKGSLSPENRQWYQWLVSTFIPAQEEWLSIDQQRIERDEKGAILSKSLTGDYRNLDAAIRGNLTPGFNQLGEAMYDVTDATQGTRTALSDLKKESPIDIGITVEPPTAKTLREIIDAIDPTEQIHVGMHPNTPGPTVLNDIIKAIDPTEDIHVGMHANPPGPVILNNVIKAIDPTEDIHVGMFADTPGPVALNNIIKAIDPTEDIHVGLHPDKPKPKVLNDIIKSIDPTEDIHVGMFPDRPGPKVLNDIIKTIDPTEDIHVGMHPDKPGPIVLNDLIKSIDPTEDIHVGMWPDKPGPTVLNDIVKTIDPTEDIHVGMWPDKPPATTLNDIVKSIDPTEDIHVGMHPDVPSTVTLNEIVKSMDPTEDIHVGVYASGSSGYGIWKTIQDYINAHPITAAVIYPRPDQRGSEPPGGFASAGASGGSVGVTINVYQANLSTPAGVTEVIGHLRRGILQVVREG